MFVWVTNTQQTWPASALRLLPVFRRDPNTLYTSTQNSLQLFPTLQEYPSGDGDQSSGTSPNSIWTLKIRPWVINMVNSWVFTLTWMPGPEDEDLSADCSSCCIARLRTSTQCRQWYVLLCCVLLGFSFSNPDHTFCDPTSPETKQIPFQTDQPPDAGPRNRQRTLISTDLLVAPSC